MSAKILRAARAFLAADGGDPIAAYREFLAAFARGEMSLRDLTIDLQDRYAACDIRPYFFESLLHAANSGERRAQGAFYTPGPIVVSMIRGVYRILRDRSWLHEPLRIIDPACGSGVFSLALETTSEFAHAELLGCDVSSPACAAAQSLLQRTKIAERNPLAEGDAFLRELTHDLAGPLVVIGNPPYANFGRRNRDPWLDRLLRDYATGPTERKRNLHDDYVKFIRWAQAAVRTAGRGIVCFVVNRTFLAGVTYGGMRASLSRDFQSIEVIDLHGDGAANDENVFGIRRGTAIVTLTSDGSRQHETNIRFAELRGSRDEKFKRLFDEVFTIDSRTIASGSFESWVNATTSKRSHAAAYHSWPSLTSIFTHYVSGVQTKNDRLFVAFSRNELIERFQSHLATRPDAPPFREAACVPFGTAPWDERVIYYEPKLLGRSRFEVMRHMLSENIGLAFMRQAFGVSRYDHVLAVNGLISDRFFASRRGAPFLAPLSLHEGSESRTNMATEWLAAISAHVGESVEPFEAFAYLYAVLFAPAYRTTFDHELRVDFPRVPYPRTCEEYRRLLSLGGQLLKLHLGRHEATHPFTIDHEARIPLRGAIQLLGDELRYGSSFMIRGIEPDAWEFHAGGFRVIERFIKQRRGRTLSERDYAQLAQIALVAREQPKILAEIDAIAGEWFRSIAY